MTSVSILNSRLYAGWSVLVLPEAGWSVVGPLSYCGQPQRHGGARPELAFNVVTSSRLLGEALHHWQPNAAEAAAFRGEERIECTHHSLAGHSNSVVGDTNIYPTTSGTFGRQGGIDRDQTAVRHCIACIEQKIQDRVLKFNRIALDLSQ